MMSRMTMVLMLIAGSLLLGAGVSGFVSDAEVSSVSLGSDFGDARYHSFNEHSIERAQQRTRRQQIGMEVVGGAGLMVVGLVFAPAKRKPLRKQVMDEPAEASAASAPARAKVVPLTPAMAIQTRYAPLRRRPNGSLHTQPQVPSAKAS